MGIRHDAMPSYLGIDASLEGTGLSLISDDGIVLLKTINPRGLRGMARLALIKAETSAFLPGLPRLVRAAVEGYAYNAVNQAFSLGEVGGMLRLLLYERGIPYADVPPVSLKKYATGSITADKAAMVAAAVAAGAILTDHNQADAYFLARIAMALEVNPPRERAKMEVVRSLAYPALKKARPRPRRLVKNPV